MVVVALLLCDSRVGSWAWLGLLSLWSFTCSPRVCLGSSRFSAFVSCPRNIAVDGLTTFVCVCLEVAVQWISVFIHGVFLIHAQCSRTGSWSLTGTPYAVSHSPCKCDPCLLTYINYGVHNYNFTQGVKWSVSCSRWEHLNTDQCSLCP